MAVPTVAVAVAFGIDPLTTPTAGQWVNVSAYVRGLSMRRGRDHELAAMQAGELTLRLRNTDRRFDPSNTSSPYYPNVRPMARVRVQVTVAGTTYDLFQGYVEDWGQEWSPRPINAGGDAEATVTAVDAFKVLNLMRMASYPAEVLNDGPLVYYRLAEAATVSTATNEGSLTDLDGYPLTYGANGPHGSVASPLIGGSTVLDVTGISPTIGPDDTTTALYSLTGECTLEAWVRFDSLASTRYIVDYDAGPFVRAFAAAVDTAGHPQFVHSYWKGARLGSTTFSFPGATLTTGTWYHIAFVRNAGGTTVECFVDGVSVGTDTEPIPADPMTGTANLYVGSSAGGSADDGQIAHLAIYDHALTAAAIARHHAATLDVFPEQLSGAFVGRVLDAVGWPAGERSLDAGMSTIREMRPEGTALAVLQSLEATEGGALYISGAGVVRFVDRASLLTTQASAITAGDSAAETTYDDAELRNDDQDLYTVVTVGRDGGNDVTVRDDAAAATYGPRELPGGSLLFATEEEQIDRANGLLNRYKAPSTRPDGVRFDLASNDTRLAAVLPRGLTSRLTLIRRPPGGGSAVQVAALIEGVQHEIDGTSRIRTKYELAPAPAAVWMLADATYGVLDTTTVLGY